MTRCLRFFLCLLMAGGFASAQDVQDAHGCKDHPLFNRMPGYAIQRCEQKTFDAHPFRLAGGKEAQVEGKVYEIRYALKSGAKEPSRLEVIRNYENAIKRIGGTVIFRDDDGNAYLKAAKDGQEFWVHVNAYITEEFMVWVVEKKAMDQAIVANAKVFADAIRTTGHAAVYGILFDTGKAVVKVESAPALEEIVRLLAADPSMKVLVVGHTDNVGTVESNMKLSQARAEAVVQALASRGVAPGRLRPFAAGPLAPVSTNETEEGRARNRRVELVKQ